MSSSGAPTGIVTVVWGLVAGLFAYTSWHPASGAPTSITVLVERQRANGVPAEDVAGQPWLPGFSIQQWVLPSNAIGRREALGCAPI